MTRVRASPRRAAVSDKIFAEPFVTLGGKQKYTVLVSIVTHTLIIAAAIIVPVVATDSLVVPVRFAIWPSPPRLHYRHRLRHRGATQNNNRRSRHPQFRSSRRRRSSQRSRSNWPSRRCTDSMASESCPEAITLAPPPAPAAEPVPDHQEPLRPGGVIKRPLKVRDAAPAYPPLARAAHVEGIVIIEATIGPDGRVQDARILRSANPLLNAEALDAVRRWEYTPTLLNGIPVAIVMTVTVDFRLR